MKKILLLLCIAGAISCNHKDDYRKFLHDPSLYSNTVHQLNTVVMGNNFSPIVASRNYLYANVAAYEVMAAAYPKEYTSLVGQLKGLKSVPAPDPKAKIDYEFAALMAFCTLGESVTFPKGSLQQYTDSIKALAKDHGMSSEVYDNSLAYADTVSKAILAWSKKDMYKEIRSMPEFSVNMNDSSRWVPTPPAYTSAMEPNWNLMRPLVLDSAKQFIPPPPFKFNVKDTNSPYYRQVMQSKTAIENLTPEQKQIADFWDDNPFKLNVVGHVMYGTKKFSPPGHWMSIVGIASKKAKADFATTVYAFTKTSIALFDAFIECWDAKYKYCTVRPETVINRYFDPNWRPYLQTPPFPEYTCGHSTCSAAAAEALTSVYGDNFAYTDTTELEFGIKSRSYTSFRDASNENNLARFYGGIHFHPSCLISTEYGKKVGDLVVARLKMKKEENKLSFTH